MNLSLPSGEGSNHSIGLRGETPSFPSGDNATRRLDLLFLTSVHLNSAEVLGLPDVNIIRRPNLLSDD